MPCDDHLDYPERAPLAPVLRHRNHYEGKTIIGIHGFAQTGKDSIGRILIGEGFQRLAFADAVRDAVYAFNPIVQPEITIKAEDGEYRKRFVRIQDVVDAVGWDVGKQMHEEVRYAQQKMGTEVGRMLFGENVWVDIVERQIRESDHDKFVITDVRFPNELAWLQSIGASTIYVKRPGVGPVNGHVSDAGLDETKFNYLINNSGTLDDLDQMVRILLSLINGKQTA